MIRGMLIYMEDEVAGLGEDSVKKRLFEI